MCLYGICPKRGVVDNIANMSPIFLYLHDWDHLLRFMRDLHLNDASSLLKVRNDLNHFRHYLHDAVQTPYDKALLELNFYAVLHEMMKVIMGGQGVVVDCPLPVDVEAWRYLFYFVSMAGQDCHIPQIAECAQKMFRYGNDQEFFPLLGVPRNKEVEEKFHHYYALKAWLSGTRDYDHPLSNAVFEFLDRNAGPFFNSHKEFLEHLRAYVHRRDAQGSGRCRCIIL